MAKRVKSAEPAIVIQDWQQADKLIRRIGELQRQIDSVEADVTDQVNRIKATGKKWGDKYSAEIKQLAASLEYFANQNKSEFSDKRTKKLTFGILGWRKSTSIITKKNTLELIKSVFSGQKLKELIRVKESVDKDALRKLTDEQLAQVKARRKVTDGFFVEPNFEKIEGDK